MAETIRSTEDRRSPQLFRRLKPFFQRQRWPARLAFLIAASALAIFLAIILFRYGSSVYNDWHERRLLHRAASMLQQEKFEQAAVTARAIGNLCRPFPFSRKQRKNRTRRKPSGGANKSHDCFRRTRTANSTSPQRHCALGSSTSRGKPWIASQLPIATEPPFMSSRAGWRVRKEISRSKRSSSPPR